MAAAASGSVMSPPAVQLAPPKDDPFTPEELKKYDGSADETPIYVAIKGTLWTIFAFNTF